MKHCFVINKENAGHEVIKDCHFNRQTQNVPKLVKKICSIKCHKIMNFLIFSFTYGAFRHDKMFQSSRRKCLTENGVKL